jgi:hypothetical protein
VIEQHAAGKTSVTRESRPVGSVDESMVSGEADRIPARIVD